MKNYCLLGLLVLGLAGSGQQAFADGPRKVSAARKRFVASHEQMYRLARKEQQLAQSGANVRQLPSPSQNRTTPSTNATTSIVATDLGRSVNPFTSIGAGRNYISTIPGLNMSALFRRGGPSDPGGASNFPGNKMFIDWSTKGGQDGTWQRSTNFMFSDDLYSTRTDYLQPAARNYAPRYPQGVLWNPAGNTDTNNVVPFTLVRVLDGTNGTWGGMGTGSYQMGDPTGTRKQGLWSSADPEYLHFRNESMEVTSNGTVFAVGPEEGLEGDVVNFTDKILVYKYTYNPNTMRFDSSIKALPFANEGGEYATRISNCGIAFGQDGQTGYIVISAANNAYDSTCTYLPYICKTTNGGESWSDFKLININKRWNEGPTPEKDDFRDSLLLGTWVRFGSAGQIQFGAETFISKTTFDDPTKHRVDYLVNDFDLTVDQHNYAHIFASLNVSGFGDTLFAEFPNGVTYYPGFGSWNIHLYINDMDSSARGTVLNQNVTLNGKWGDLDNDNENITEANRTQITRSADRSVLGFVYYDTDTAAFPPQTEDDNSNPDMWIRTMRVAGPGQFFLSSHSRNQTKGSESAGKVVCGSVAPVMLNTSTGHSIVSTYLSLSTYDPVQTTAVWPCTHVYLGGVNVAPATAVDSFPKAVGLGRLITRTLPRFTGKKSSIAGDVQVFPNPAADVLLATISSEKGGVSEFRVLNVLGREVLKEVRNLEPGIGTQSLSVSKLAPGTYTLQVKTGGEIRIGRFVVR